MPPAPPLPSPNADAAAGFKPAFTMRELLDAGAHFGHHTRLWNPRMAPYLYGKRDRLHIIDLQQTAPMLRRALQGLYEVAAKSGRVLFVGTKRYASEAVAEAAKRCGQPYVNHRWLGGMLTNWRTVSASIHRLRRLEEELVVPEGESRRTKKERLRLTRERDKLERALGGIKDMGGLPNALFVIDIARESNAVAEAVKLGVPVAAVVDSNADPSMVTWPVPGNDDSRRAVSLYCRLVSDAILSGLQEELRRRSADMGALPDPAAEPLPAAGLPAAGLPVAGLPAAAPQGAKKGTESLASPVPAAARQEKGRPAAPSGRKPSPAAS